MFRQTAIVVLVLLCVGDASAIEPSKARGPTYRTIAPHGARPLRGYLRHPAQLEPLPVEPYAWGWFGAAPRAHGGWQRGFYGEPRFTNRTGR